MTPSRISEARDLLLKEVTKLGTPRKPSTVIRYMAALSHCFTIAVSEWEWLEHNPVRKVRKPTGATGRVRFLADDERVRLMAACKKSDNSILYLVVVIALPTAMRKAECSGQVNLATD